MNHEMLDSRTRFSFRLGTAHSSPPKSAGSRSPLVVPEFRDVSLWTRRMWFLRAERLQVSVVVSRMAA